MSDRLPIKEIFEAKAQALAARAICEPVTMTEDRWKELATLLSIFHRHWLAAHHPLPPCPITFGQVPQVMH